MVHQVLAKGNASLRRNDVSIGQVCPSGSRSTEIAVFVILRHQLVQLLHLRRCGHGEVRDILTGKELIRRQTILCNYRIVLKWFTENLLGIF